VDTAAAELQNLVEPKIDREFSSGSIKNPSLLSDNQTRQSEHSITPTSQIPSSSVVDEATEQLNDTDTSGSEKEAILLKNISEETPEVVIVRAEQRTNTDELELRVEENASQMSEELPKIDDTFTTAPELNDTVARAQLIAGSRDETAAIILDGLVTSGPTDPHEDIPSFSEWAQKRLEEAEKKKSEYRCFRILDLLFARKISLTVVVLLYSSSKCLRADAGRSRTRRKRHENSFQKLCFTRLWSQDRGG